MKYVLQFIKFISHAATIILGISLVLCLILFFWKGESQDVSLPLLYSLTIALVISAAVYSVFRVLYSLWGY